MAGTYAAGAGPAPRSVSATRMELLQTRRRLEQVSRAIDLLERKREALVTELFRLARPALDARTAIEEQAAEAYPLLLGAVGALGASDIEVVSWPHRHIGLELRSERVWGVPVAEIVDRPTIQRTPEARGLPLWSAPVADLAAERFEILIDLLLDAAPREMMIRRLGVALAKTTRQVNTLRFRVAPSLAAKEAAIRSALEEREREERLRLKHLLSIRRRAT